MCGFRILQIKMDGEDLHDPESVLLVFHSFDRHCVMLLRHLLHHDQKE
jgi:hypothetical protein